MLLTRRHFLYGVAGVAALAALGGGYAYMQSNEDPGDVTTLNVPENAVFTSEDCAQIEDASSVMSLSASVELPYGSLVWANDDIAACLLPTETSKPLAQIALLALGTGNYVTVVSNAVGESEGFEIYDVRACSKGVVWTEADILEGTWRIYHASSDGSSIGTPALAEEGDSDWEMPTLAAVGDHAFWQCIPRKDGPAKSEDSLLKRAAFGSSNSETVYTSHGRMATAPYAGADSVTITPRADTSGTYYQLTNINASTGAVTDALVLPASMKPLEAGFGDTGFTFSFESIYNYGGGIANLGTYTPAGEVSTGEQCALSGFNCKIQRTILQRIDLVPLPKDAVRSPFMVRKLVHGEINVGCMRNRFREQAVLRLRGGGWSDRLWRLLGLIGFHLTRRHVFEYRPYATWGNANQAMSRQDLATSLIARQTSGKSGRREDGIEGPTGATSPRIIARFPTQ